MSEPLDAAVVPVRPPAAIRRACDLHATAGLLATPLTPVQTIAVTGGKGGVGKTNVAVNLAAALASEQRDVLLFDADLQLGNVDRLLDLHARHTLLEVIRGERRLDEVTIMTSPGLTVIPGCSGVVEMARLSHMQCANLIRSFSDLPTHADTMIIDLATGLSDSSLCLTRAAREVIVVVCDEPTSVQDAFSTIRVLNEWGAVRRFRVVANKVESSHQGLELYAALTRLTDRHLDVLLDYCGSIPFDPQLRRAVAEQRPVVQAYPRSPAALAFSKLVTRVDRWPRPQSPEGHIEFFVERLIQATDRTC